jgi:G3E family GTPase
VVDADNFLDTYESFLAIEKQLAASDVFIINKTDLASSETVEQIKEIVRQFNPDPRFYEAVYADVSFDGLFREGGLRGLKGTGGRTPAALTPAELEAYIDELLDDEAAEVTPPDRLLSLVVYRPEATEDGLRAWLAGLPERVVRGKGLVRLENRLWLFSLVNGNWTLEPYAGATPPEEVVDRLVFISRPEQIKEIAERETRNGSDS